MYKLTTVTYGTVSATYLATRTLKQLAMDEANNFPLAVPVVMSDSYMDAMLSGSESIEDVIELQHQLIEMFKTAGMHLHKCIEQQRPTSFTKRMVFSTIARPLTFWVSSDRS
ncbi:integrase catalytic domain-containing protein [Trichonephila clavipes]|nr:integrase catalytic domain-containing protein [Trichonephila clavipes]